MGDGGVMQSFDSALFNLSKEIRLGASVSGLEELFLHITLVQHQRLRQTIERDAGVLKKEEASNQIEDFEPMSAAHQSLSGRLEEQLYRLQVLNGELPEIVELAQMRSEEIIYLSSPDNHRISSEECHSYLFENESLENKRQNE